MRCIAHALRRRIDLEKSEVTSAGDGEQDAVGPVDARLKERAGDRLLSRLYPPRTGTQPPDRREEKF